MNGAARCGRLWFPALAAAVVSATCVGSGARLPSEAVAGFADRHVTYSDFEQWVRASTGDQTVDFSAAALSGLFEQYLDELLLVHWARDLDLIDGSDRVGAGDAAGAERAIRRLLERYPPEAVDAEAIQEHYRSHAADHERPARVRLHQLLFESREEAEAAVAEIEGGADFGELVARRFPEVGERAGWLGELSRDDLPPELVEPVFSTPPGSETGVLADETGFHVFFVDALLPAEDVPLEEVEDEIRERLEAQARRKQLDRLAGQARERYNLVLATERLPFTFRPSQPPVQPGSPAEPG